MDAPWEDPDWYDLHDTTWTAGPTREPEHYAECVLALPPLGPATHLLDAGAGTGKLSLLAARAYPELGRVTLLEPNAAKLARAEARLRAALPRAELARVEAGLGGAALPALPPADVVLVGSVLMPVMELRGGTHAEGLAFCRAALGQLRALLRPGGQLFLLETLAAPWARGGPRDPVRRLRLPELEAEVEAAGFARPECAFRLRDRVVLATTKTAT